MSVIPSSQSSTQDDFIQRYLKPESTTHNKYDSSVENSNLCPTGKIRGVNLGGWLLIERWMTPSLYKDLPKDTQGDWGFCEVLGKRECSRRLKKHWDTWITKKDLQALYDSGVNLVRIPIGYWSFVPRNNEPYIQGAEAYFKKALDWSQEIGLKVMIDLHGLAGSQNGFDNSGRAGPIEWTNSTSNIKNSLEFVELIAKKYVTNYKPIIHSFQVINEPANWGIDMNILKKYYKDSYNLIQKIVPETKVAFHDAFMPLSYWDEFMKDYPDVLMGKHYYLAHDPNQFNNTHEQHLNQIPNIGKDLKTSNYSVVIGEWSLGTAICNKWENGGCADRQDTINEDTPEYNQFAKALFQIQHQTYESYSDGWVFWAAKTETMNEWSFLDSIKRNWIPDWSKCNQQPGYSPSTPYKLPAYNRPTYNVPSYNVPNYSYPSLY